MASTLYQSSPIGSPSGSPRSCLYLSRQSAFQPKADWRASFTKRETCRGPPPMPLILRQHDGVWLSSLSNTPTPTKEPSPQLQSETPSTPPKAARDNVTKPSRSRLSLGRIPKTLRCHVCQATVREQHFQNHLFFGVVSCDLCDLVCRTCWCFAQLKEDTHTRYSSCKHSFSYTEDPYEYLLPRLSGSDDMDVGGSLTLPNKLRVLQHYVNQLISLQLRDPWSTAVRKCRSRLLKFHTVTPPVPAKDVEFPKDIPEKSADHLGVEDGANTNPALSKERIEWDSSSRMPAKSLTCPSPARQESREEKNMDDGVLLTQTYDLQHLEQTVEYVELEEQCKLDGVQNQRHVQSKPKKRRKTSDYKRLKAHRLTPPHRKRRPPMVPVFSVEEVDKEKVDKEENKEKDESDLVVEEVALPKDGYYLMVREAVEECPMCYTSLSPNHCSVNIKTFLVTVSCPKCALLVYIVPDLPGGLQIVTDGGGGNIITETKQNNHHNTSQNVRVRDFFAR